MIISEHLFERTKSKLCTNILFCFISNLVLFLNDLKNRVSCVSNIKNTADQVYGFVYPIRF